MANSEIRIELVDASRYQQVFSYVYEDFYPRERIQTAAGLKKTTFFNMVPLFMQWLPQQVSFVAIDSDTNEVVGIAINFMLCEPFCYETSLAAANFGQRAIMTFFDRLEENHDIFKLFNVAKGMELSFLGVKEGYSGRGIARELVQKTIEEATRRKLDFVQSFPTSPKTIGLHEKLGFQTLNELAFTDHYLDQIPAFPHALPNDRAQFVVKLIN